MRLFFLILLLVNAGAFGYIRFEESRDSAGGQIALLQIAPDKIKLLKSGTLSSGSKDKGAATRPQPALVCLEWGSFGADEAARAAAALAQLALGDKVSQRETGDSYWVYIPPLKTKAEVDRKMGDLKVLGVTDSYVVQDSDQWKLAISLGIFKSEEAAVNYLAQLRQKGVRSAVVGPRGAKASLFVIRDPGDAVASKIAEFKADFPTATLKAAACAEPVAAKN
jgi:hypothetical protein